MQLNSVRNLLNYAYKLYIKRDPRIIRHRKWIKDDAEQTLRINYPLNEESIVIDFGGYEGRWANDIYKKYHCRIFIFEPVKSYYQIIAERFKNNKKIQVFNYGISDETKTMKIFLQHDASSVFTENSNSKHSKYEMIKVLDIIESIKICNVDEIDLMKFNIEGGEYLTLPRLISSGYVIKCKNLQIQFHNFIKNSEKMREKITRDLSKTHHLTYDYPWSFENWEINNKK